MRQDPAPSRMINKRGIKMNLSDYIKQLQKLEKEYGDLPVIYASDDEGNNYHKVEGSTAGSPCQVEDIDDYYLERVYFEDDEEDTIGYNAVIIN